MGEAGATSVVEPLAVCVCVSLLTCVSLHVCLSAYGCGFYCHTEGVSLLHNQVLASLVCMCIVLGVHLLVLNE